MWGDGVSGSLRVSDGRRGRRSYIHLRCISYLDISCYRCIIVVNRVAITRLCKLQHKANRGKERKRRFPYMSHPLRKPG